MKIYSLIISILFVSNAIVNQSACSSISSSSQLRWMRGKWEGIGHQINDTTWKVELDFRDKQNIKINYPSLSCGGNWNFTKIENNEIKLLEDISFGLNNCDQGVEVVVKKISNKELDVNYFLEIEGVRTKIAYAVLKKVE